MTNKEKTLAAIELADQGCKKFAVKELENIKAEIKKENLKCESDTTEEFVACGMEIAEKIIDNHIKELKGE